MIHNNVDKQVCRLSKDNDDLFLYYTVTSHCPSVPYYVKSMLVQYSNSAGNYWLSTACATPYIGLMRGLWEENYLTEHRHPLARPWGMPSGHIAPCIS